MAVENMTARLDDLLPTYDRDEKHVTTINAAPDRVYAAIWQMTADEIPLFRLLMGIRAMPARLTRRGSPPRTTQAPLFKAFLARDFALLVEEPERELIVGLIAQPWKLRGGSAHPITGISDFVGFNEPGYAKIVMNFLLHVRGDRTELSTETRIHATDSAARTQFTRYWRVIGFGSATIRREWLRAIKRRAERPQSP